MHIVGPEKPRHGKTAHTASFSLTYSPGMLGSIARYGGRLVREVYQIPRTECSAALIRMIGRRARGGQIL